MTEHLDANNRARIDFDLTQPLWPGDDGLGSEIDFDDWEKALTGMAM